MWGVRGDMATEVAMSGRRGAIDFRGGDASAFNIGGFTAIGVYTRIAV
jgi:hypothetical protein